MARRRGRFDILDTILLYFMLLVLVWGYSFAEYVNELGAYPLMSRDVDDYGTGLTGPPSLPITPGGWNPNTLLKVGQFFQYHIRSTKEINISYEVVKERRGFLIIESFAQIQTRASSRTKSSYITINPRTINVQERFSIDKKTGALPLTSSYTATFWNMEGCIPTRYYFQNSYLEEGAAWQVPGTESMGHVIGTEDISGFLNYVVLFTVGGQNHSTFWVNREAPAIFRFEGENCFGRGRITSRLVKYMPDPKTAYEI